MAGEAIAIVSVTSGTVIAITVPYIASRLERIKLREQALSTRLDELRQRLDDGMTALASAERAVDAADRAVESAQLRHATPADRNDATATVAALRTANGEVFKCWQLLAIRLGPKNNVVQAYEAALTSTQELEKELDDILASGPPSDMPDAYAEAVKEVGAIRDRYAIARASFLDAASSVIGPS